jgi:hypothetical protein
VPEIQIFPNHTLAFIEANKAPKHYGARPVLIVPNESSRWADKSGKVWVVKRDGEHFLRADGTWQ